jgi:hypothetical protein
MGYVKMLSTRTRGAKRDPMARPYLLQTAMVEVRSRTGIALDEIHTLRQDPGSLTSASNHRRQRDYSLCKNQEENESQSVYPACCNL